MELNIFKATISAHLNKEFLFPTLRICRVISGEFGWQIGRNTIQVKGGDIVLLNNLVSRRIMSTKSTASEIEVFEFPPVYILNRKLLPKMFYSENPVTVSSKNRKLVGDLLSVLSEAYESMPNLDIPRHMLQAVFDLLENEDLYFLSNKKHSTIMLDAVEFIWAHYCEHISVPDVAAYLSISKNHLEKLFKDMYGIGVGAYIRIIRVYKALSLLEEDNEKTVLDIAFSCGFNSSSGFYKAYKAVIGGNPRRTTDQNCSAHNEGSAGCCQRFTAVESG